MKKVIGEGRKKKVPSTFDWMYRDDRQEVSADIRQVYLELSTDCNFSCRTCVRFSIDNFKTAPMEMGLLETIIKELRKISTLERVVLLGFGEALCHPQIKNILRTLTSLACETVLVTNASLLSEELASLLCRLELDQVVISWDDSINGPGRVIRRGKNQSQVTENIKKLIAARRENNLPRIGMQIVATKSNHTSIPDIINFGAELGIDHFFVSNLFPYSEAMSHEIIYAPPVKRKETLRGIVQREVRKFTIEVAESLPDRSRRCPFLERGTIFITADGKAAPCPELAYTHHAWYYGKARIHQRRIFGSIPEKSIDKIWADNLFQDFRKNFLYWDFPDCSSCEAQGDCSHRQSGKDCYWNPTPCGECLWAKKIIICP